MVRVTMYNVVYRETFHCDIGTLLYQKLRKMIFTLFVLCTVQLVRCLKCTTCYSLLELKNCYTI